MNKLSKYTHTFVDGSNTLLYHLVSDRVIVLQPELSAIVSQTKKNIDELDSKHPELFKQMQLNGMIISEEKNEAQCLFDMWEETDSNPTFFGIIINPTLDCNLRCWYCYEKHEKGTTMQEETLQSLLCLIDKKAAEKELKHLNVSFFGGEPLLPYKQVVLPLLIYASQLCQKKGIFFSSNFTTNAVLLTPERIEELKRIKTKTPISFQITLDGNREAHNLIRYSRKNAPTYDLIIKHIHAALQLGFLANVRLNYTKDNIDTFIDIIQDFREIEVEKRKRLRFNFQQIWQDKSQNAEAREKVQKLIELFQQEGFSTESDVVYQRHNCYADKSNCVVVNYNGDVFKCTARDFNKERREGVLTVDGDIMWNEAYTRRMSIKYSNTSCRNCSILPICNGGCTQNKLDNPNHEQCYLNMGEKEKTATVLKRLKQVLSKQ